VIVPCRQERFLRRTDRAIRRSDPDLASMLSIFARITAAERMPAREQLRPRLAWAWRVLLAPVTACRAESRRCATCNLMSVYDRPAAVLATGTACRCRSRLDPASAGPSPVAWRETAAWAVPVPHPVKP
jgi:hypothetical protein